MKNENNKQYLKLLAIGDCNTKGVNEAPFENLPQTFCNILVEKGLGIEIHNFGMAMFTTREGVEIAKTAPKDVDILFLNFGLVDSWLTVLSKWYVPYYPDNSLRKIKRKALKSLKKRLRGKFFRKFLALSNVVPIFEYKYNLNEIINTVSANSPNLKVVLWGLAPAPHEKSREKELIAYDKIIKQVSVENDCLYIETRKLFEQFETSYLYRDHVHIGLNGQRIIALEIAKQLGF